jgi:hypothetical protein
MSEHKEISTQNVQVRDEHDNHDDIVVLDDETRDLINSPRKNSEMKMLFSVSRGTTKEDMIIRIAGKVQDEIQNSDSDNQHLVKSLEIKVKNYQKEIDETWQLYYADPLPMQQVSNKIKVLKKKRKGTNFSLTPYRRLKASTILRKL